jgi:hypothetical protein
MGNIYSYIYSDNSEQNYSLCVNSFAPTDRNINLDISKVDDDKSDEDNFFMINHKVF